MCNSTHGYSKIEDIYFCYNIFLLLSPTSLSQSEHTVMYYSNQNWIWAQGYPNQTISFKSADAKYGLASTIMCYIYNKKLFWY